MVDIDSNERDLFWNVDYERSILNESMFARIYCPSCGEIEKAFFRDKNSKCKKCGSSGLQVSEFNQRNAIVADITEKFALSTFRKILEDTDELKGKYFVKRNVECKELELSGQSKADLAILDIDTDAPVKPERIKCLFEVKMSAIWNWKESDTENPIADYDGHAGRPSIFRTDSILKAIGKAAVIRSCVGNERIPFIVVGNTPPPPGYRDKVDGTVRAGLIQKWISLTPNPLIVDKTSKVQQRDPQSTFGFVKNREL